MKGTKDLTNGPIFGQLLKLAIPIMGTSFIQMAYNLTDMAWVGRLGSESVAAIGSVGLLSWMAQSISLLNKVGAEVSVAQAIGSRNENVARSLASHNITISLIISLVISTIYFGFSYDIITLFGLNAGITMQASDYLRIIATALPFFFMSAAFTGIFNASGRSLFPFVINGIGLLLNMILDPILIFVFQMGTDGAAIATWTAQFTVFLLFIYNLKYRKVLLGGIQLLTKLRKDYSLRILRLGIPVAMLNTLFAFVNMFLGKTASSQGGHLGLLTLTTGGQIEAITWNTAQGFSTALSSFVAQNYASMKTYRITKAFYMTIGLAFVFGLICTFVFIYYGNEIFSIFVPEKEAFTVGGRYLMIDGYSQLFMMVEITMQGMFYGMGMTFPPAIISISCNYMRIPLALWLISFGLGLDGIWWSISITSIMKGIICLVWFLIIRHKKLVNNIID